MRLTPHNSSAPSRALAAAGVLAVSPEEFAAAMAGLGPFEARPHLAVAVSGGRDSLALALLAQGWAERRGGRLTALIVDHRLRSESSEEAAQVARALRGRGIDAEILPWLADKPASGISEAARAARYELLQRRCQALGILHLLLGHQADDQAETVLLRLADASGPEGLAAMSAIGETRNLRLLRPLLALPRARLGASVLAQGLSWIDDPSNERDDYARSIARKVLAPETSEALADIAADAASLRALVDRKLAMLLVELVGVHPAGFAWLDAAGFAALPATLARRLLGRLAATFGGRHYPARRTGLERAVVALCAGRSAVAGGCRFIPRGRRILVCREAGAIGAPVAAKAGRLMLWDRRYALVPGEDGLVAKLGQAGRLVLRADASAGLRDLPAAAAEALPALWNEEGLRAVFLPGAQPNGPGGGDRRGEPAPATLIPCLAAALQPSQGLAPPARQLVLPPGEPMYLDRQSFSRRGRP